jgi:hypothetical protein
MSEKADRGILGPIEIETSSVKGEIELPSWEILNANFNNELDDFYFVQLDKLR